MDQHQHLSGQALNWLPQLQPQPVLAPGPTASVGSIKRPRSPHEAHPAPTHGADDGELDAEGEPDVQLPQPPPELLFHHQAQGLSLHLPLPPPPPLQQTSVLDPQLDPVQALFPHQQQQQTPLLGVGGDGSDRPIASNSRVHTAQLLSQNAIAGSSSERAVTGVSTTLSEQQSPSQEHVAAPSSLAEASTMPDREKFDAAVEGYIQGLHPIKRNKALMSSSLHHLVLAILVDPQNTKQGDPQLRFWVRQRFALLANAEGNFVMHEEKKVVLREALFDVISAAHAQSEHGGRDKTYAEVKKMWSYVPKEVVTIFVKICPTCNGKRVTIKGKRPKFEKREPLPKDILNGPADDGVPDPNGLVPTSIVSTASGADIDQVQQAHGSSASIPSAMPSGVSSSSSPLSLPLPLQPFQLPSPLPLPVPPSPASSLPVQHDNALTTGRAAGTSSAAAPSQRSGRKSAQAASAGIGALAVLQHDDEGVKYRVKKMDHQVKEGSGEGADEASGEDGTPREDRDGPDGTDVDAPGELDEPPAVTELAGDDMIDPDLQVNGLLNDDASVQDYPPIAGFDMLGAAQAAGSSSDQNLHILYSRD